MRIFIVILTHCQCLLMLIYGKWSFPQSLDTVAVFNSSLRVEKKKKKKSQIQIHLIPILKNKREVVSHIQTHFSSFFFFPAPYFLCVIINELVVGSTTNSPYLRQTLVVTALSSHCVEESPTSSTPSHLSPWLKAGKRAQAGRLRKHQKESIPYEEQLCFPSAL